MKKGINNLFALLVIAMQIGLYGCKESGCTDSRAINYNNTANKDDGSCIVCEENVQGIGERVEDIYDNNSGSVHYGQLVAKVYFNQYTEKYNDTLCGTDKCILKYYIKNLVNSKMTIQYYISVSNGQSTIFSLNSIAPVAALSNGAVNNIASDSFYSCYPIASWIVNINNVNILYQ